MIKIKIVKTGEIQEVTPNIAFGLIDSGVAIKFTETSYTTRQMSTNDRALPNPDVDGKEDKKKDGKNYKTR